MKFAKFLNLYCVTACWRADLSFLGSAAKIISSFDHESSCYLSLSFKSIFLYNICCLWSNGDFVGRRSEGRRWKVGESVISTSLGCCCWNANNSPCGETFSFEVIHYSVSSQGIRISIPQQRNVEFDGQMHGWKIDVKGGI